jgi:hypothetical protein
MANRKQTNMKKRLSKKAKSQRKQARKKNVISKPANEQEQSPTPASGTSTDAPSQATPT